MIPVTSFSGRSVALFGLGGSGLVTAKALIAGGATVSAWDDGEASRAKAEAEGVPLTDLRTADWSGFAALVLSPRRAADPSEPHWSAVKAREAGVEIIAISSFSPERRLVAPEAPVVAITGTNGKSTTTALIAHLLKVGGWQVEMAAISARRRFRLSRLRRAACMCLRFPLSRSTLPRRSTPRSA